MVGSVVGRDVGCFVAIFDEWFDEVKVESNSAACAFITEIGRISGDVEDYVAGTIMEFGTGVCFHVVFNNNKISPMVVKVVCS